MSSKVVLGKSPKGASVRDSEILSSYRMMGKCIVRIMFDMIRPQTTLQATR
jgi:hypothetical protein